MLGVGLIAAAASGGRFTPIRPTLSYAGSGTSNLGKFTITNYNSSFVYQVIAGSGSVSGNTLTVTPTTGEATLIARSPKGTVNSLGVRGIRNAPIFNPQSSVTYLVGNYPVTYVNGVATWSCPGCNPDGGIYGEGVCRCVDTIPAFYSNLFPSGYSWSGSDYTNGSGEWWRILNA